ncbi:MAG: transporter [Pseudomonadota bacterium]
MIRCAPLLLIITLLVSGRCWAQDSEPRRWTHLPVGINVVGTSLGVTNGDIFLDPVLEIEDANLETYTVSTSFVHSFALLGKTTRVDVAVPYTMGRWEGQLSGEPASTRRRGFRDPGIRLSMLLYGGEALSRAEFAQTERSNTVVGAALALRLPWGEYYPERLINLGNNRWTLRPQLGVTHRKGDWAYELTGSVFIYGDNDDLMGSRLEVDPLWAVQAHLIRYFNKGRWASLSSAWGDGADQTVDGMARDISTENWLIALAYGLPLSRQHSLKFAWIRGRTQRNDGSDIDSFSIGFTWVLP